MITNINYFLTKINFRQVIFTKSQDVPDNNKTQLDNFNTEHDNRQIVSDICQHQSDNINND